MGFLLSRFGVAEQVLVVALLDYGLFLLPRCAVRAMGGWKCCIYANLWHV